MRLVLVVTLLFALAGCRADRPATTASDRTSAVVPTGPAAGPWFTNEAEASQLRFVHFNGMSGEFYYPEIMPPGVALFDYDGDDDLDVFVVQGQMLGTKGLNEAVFVPHAPLRGRLFRNDLTVLPGGKRAPQFIDVTDVSGIGQRGYGMGVAAGDYNNDGCIDLYVTSFGANQLFRNNCNGTFSDATEQSRTADPGWSVSASFVDIDRDGWLDLFVGHYVRYSIASNTRCYSVTGLSDYCPPQVYRAEPSHLFRNNKDGTFTDVTSTAGLSSEFGPALGVSTADFNGDGWIDIHVSNDSTPNQLWINGRNGTFKNTALLSGTAVSPEGLAKASMGVDAGDFDNDGDEDLYIAELTGQGADLYVNDGTGVFTDESARAGLRLATLPSTGFGAGWLDFDNDGWLDIVTVNGAVTHTVEALARNEPFALQQRNQLFRNLGNGKFEDVSEMAGASFDLTDVSRGAAIGDIDNDGDPDVVVANDSGPIRLLINQVGNRQHWVGLRLVGQVGRADRDMVGARVLVLRSDGSKAWRRARADGSYASANDPRVLVGLGDSAQPPRIRVIWPGGRIEEWSAVVIDRYTTLKEGTGTNVPKNPS